MADFQAVEATNCTLGNRRNCRNCISRPRAWCEPRTTDGMVVAQRVEVAEVAQMAVAAMVRVVKAVVVRVTKAVEAKVAVV